MQSGEGKEDHAERKVVCGKTETKTRQSAHSVLVYGVDYYEK